MLIVRELANKKIKAATMVLIGNESYHAEQIVIVVKGIQVDLIMMVGQRLEFISSKIRAFRRVASRVSELQNIL